MSHDLSEPDPFVEISTDDMAEVTGGLRRAERHRNGGGFHPFRWLYRGIVFGIGSHRGGNELAHRMYGKHTTAGDVARSRAAMKKYLYDGDKMPRGIPNLFG